MSGPSNITTSTLGMMSYCSMIRTERRKPIVQDGETLGLESTQSATGEEQYVETSRAGRDDVATSKPQGIVVIESAITNN